MKIRNEAIIGLCVIAIFILLLVALLKGIDGTLLASGIAVIAGIAGFTIKKVRDQVKHRTKRP